jgi:hypothetical protein
VHRSRRLLDIAALGHKLARLLQALADGYLAPSSYGTSACTSEQQTLEDVKESATFKPPVVVVLPLAIYEWACRWPSFGAMACEARAAGPHRRRRRSYVHQSLGHYTKRLCALSSAG